MRTRFSTSAATPSRRLVALILSAAVILVVSAASAGAQSGRRIPKRPSNTEPPPPAPKEQPEKDSSSESTAATTPVLVVSDLYDIGSDSAILTRIVTDGIMERLREARSIKAQAAGGDVNRKEASELAKKSPDTYVLWVELRSDSTDSMQGMRNPRSLYVDYVVFTPGTGKQKTMGHVYQRSRVGAIGVPYPGPPSTTLGSVEYTLRWAGNETADRLLDALGHPRLPQIPR